MSEPETPRMLIASINGCTVGTLRDERGYWTFQYATEWLEHDKTYPLSPDFPLQTGKFSDDSSRRTVAWYFDNLLPEESAREVLAADAGVTVEDAWGLLAYFGAESAGAITLLPPDAPPTRAGITPLSNETLQQRIDAMPRRSLSANAPKRMSLAGAQHKLAVVVKNGALFEPVGSECSTHILKPDSKTDGYPHTAINEHFCMQLAAMLRLPVPATEVRYVPWPVYLVERFDRVPHEGALERVHTMDALQLLSYDRALKYLKASAATLKDCIGHCAATLRTQQDLFAWTVFNVLVGNADAHMKNISFLVDETGIRLAPFYDIVSTVVYTTPEHDRHGPWWPEVKLSMPIGEAESFSSITRADLLSLARDIGLPARPAERLLNQMVTSIVPAAEALASRMGAHAGERRLLNAIVHLPVKEMAKRLAKPTA